MPFANIHLPRGRRRPRQSLLPGPGGIHVFDPAAYWTWEPQAVCLPPQG
jgi:hypothetical protein